MEFGEAHLLDDGAHGCLDRALPPLIEHGACDEAFEEDDTIDGALVPLLILEPCVGAMDYGQVDTWSLYSLWQPNPTFGHV